MILPPVIFEGRRSPDLQTCSVRVVPVRGAGGPSGVPLPMSTLGKEAAPAYDWASPNRGAEALAHSLLAFATYDLDIADAHFREFALTIVAKLQVQGFDLKSADVLEWIKARQPQPGGNFPP